MLKKIRMIGVVLITAVAAPLVLGQSSAFNPWLDIPSYDHSLIWQLRRGEDAKAARQPVQHPAAAVETFTRLSVIDQADDALTMLKRILETADTTQTTLTNLWVT